MPTRSSARRAWCGTGPWGCSRFRPSTPARARSRTRSRTRAASPSSAVATARPRSVSSAWQTRSTTSAREVARRWSSSSAATFRAWTHFVPERKPVIAANWKMHHDHLVAIQVVQKLSYRLDPDDYDAVDVVICPPFTDLRTLQTLIDSDKLSFGLGAQNCYWEETGAFTGEV